LNDNLFEISAVHAVSLAITWCKSLTLGQ